MKTTLTSYNVFCYSQLSSHFHCCSFCGIVNVLNTFFNFSLSLSLSFSDGAGKKRIPSSTSIYFDVTGCASCHRSFGTAQRSVTDLETGFSLFPTRLPVIFRSVRLASKNLSIRLDSNILRLLL